MGHGRTHVSLGTWGGKVRVVSRVRGNFDGATCNTTNLPSGVVTADHGAAVASISSGTLG